VRICLELNAINRAEKVNTSIIVPLFNHLQATQAMLASLLASVPGRVDHEIILIDDASTDGTREWLDTLTDPRIRILKNATNVGFAATNNRAVRISSGEVLALVNNDLLFEDGWLQPMLDVLFDPALQAGVVGNVQRAVTGRDVDHAGMDIDYRGQLSHIRSLDAGADAPFIQRFAVTAACCVVRHDAFDSVGGFDEAFVNGGEDMDLCFKLAQRGMVNYVAFDSAVLHHVSLSRGKPGLQDERNSELLFERWSSVLETRLAARWSDRLASGDVSEPSAGHDDMNIELPVADPPQTARLVARCILQREAFHRRARLSIPGEGPDYSSIEVSGPFHPADLPGYVHPDGELGLVLPAGAGMLGLFVRGHYYLPRSSVRDVPDVWAVLVVNDVQRTAVKLTGGDFTTGFHRPLVWQDMSSSIRLRLEGRDPLSGLVVEIPEELGRDIYLKDLVVDDGPGMPLHSMRRASAAVLQNAARHA
jgi:O-antigen biosynthesis protein